MEHNELPLGFSLQSDVDGWAVRFPKTLLDQFKPHFRGAKWRSNLQSWLIGPRSKKKFEVWAKEMADKAIQIEALNDLDTEDSINAFTNSLLIDKVIFLRTQLDHMLGDDEVQRKHDEIQIEIDRVEKTVESLKKSLIQKNETRKLLEGKLQQIQQVESERKQLQNDCTEQDNQIKLIVNKAIDLELLKNAYSKISSLFGKVGSQIRMEFNSAQDQIKEQQQVLHSLGLHSKGMEEMYRMNMNRPDRDHLPSFSSIYNIVEYVEEED